MANRTDTFDRADAGSLGTPSDGGSAWTSSNGQILSNQAVAIFSADPPVTNRLETSVADVEVQCTVAAVYVLGGASCGPSVRDSDGLNFLVLECYSDAAARISKIEAGVRTVLATCSETFTAGDVAKLTANGTSLEAFRNGVSIGSTTSSFNQSVTTHGFAMGSATTDRNKIDDWSSVDFAPPATTFLGDEGGLLIQITETW